MKWKNCLVSSTWHEMHNDLKNLRILCEWHAGATQTDRQTDQSQESFPSSVNLNIVCISWSITIDQPCGPNLQGFAGEQPDQAGRGCQADSPVTAIKRHYQQRFLHPMAPSLSLILDSEGTVLLHLLKVPQTVPWGQTEHNYRTRCSAQLWLNRKKSKQKKKTPTAPILDNQLSIWDKCWLKTIWKFPHCTAIILKRCRVLKDCIFSNTLLNTNS